MKRKMKRTATLRRCTWISVATTFALAWVNYWATFALLCIAAVCAIAWLIVGHYEWYDEQQSKNAK